MSNARIQFSTADEAKWDSINPTLREGELVIVKKTNGKYKLYVGAPGGSTYKNSTLVWDQDYAEQVAADAETALESAEDSATAAANSASAAALSASNASTSATNAASSASAAASSQSSAAASASAASGSANAASSSATTASSKADDAAKSASAAAGSASAANTSATNAANSASTATTRANAAADSATNAASSASAAAGSASAASTSAGEAASSATEAAKSAQQAAASAASLTIDSALSTTSTNAVQNKVVTVALNGKLPIISGAAAHNAGFRGKNLGTSVTSAQWSAIKAGTFDDMYIGDYWSIGGVDYVIAAFDYYLKTGDNAAVSHHHVTLVPRTALYNAQMNETNVVTGGYVGSKMYTSNLNQAKTTIQNAFGSAHILTIRQLFTTATNAQYGFATAFEWSDASVWLMNEVNVYGCYIHTDMYHVVNNWTASKYSIDNSQYPLFAFDKTAIHTRYNYWLRDVATSTDFANVSGYGDGGCNNASNSNGVRPAFNIYQS